MGAPGQKSLTGDESCHAIGKNDRLLSKCVGAFAPDFYQRVFLRLSLTSASSSPLPFQRQGILPETRFPNHGETQESILW